MITTTLKQIRGKEACREGYRKLVKSLPEDHEQDDPITIAQVLKSNGLDDALWTVAVACGRVDIVIEFAAWCAEREKQKAKLIEMCGEVER